MRQTFGMSTGRAKERGQASESRSVSGALGRTSARQAGRTKVEDLLPRIPNGPFTELGLAAQDGRAGVYNGARIYAFSGSVLRHGSGRVKVMVRRRRRVGASGRRHGEG